MIFVIALKLVTYIIYETKILNANTKMYSIMQTKRGKSIVPNCKNPITFRIKRGEEENALKVTYHR